MMLQLITADVAGRARQTRRHGDVARTIERLFGPEPALSRDLRLPPAARRRFTPLIDSDRFRAACGGFQRLRLVVRSGTHPFLGALACGLHVAFAIARGREAAVGREPRGLPSLIA
jgi:hypothetical protein